MPPDSWTMTSLLPQPVTTPEYVEFDSTSSWSSGHPRVYAAFGFGETNGERETSATPSTTGNALDELEY